MYKRQVSDGLLFEIPYRIYLHTGKEELLKSSIIYFDRYLKYLKTRTDNDGFVRFGLDDWARPIYDDERDNVTVPVELINALLIINFYKIAKLAAQLCRCV